MSEGARALWTLVLVLVGTVGALAVLDAVPGWLHGQPRGVRRAASVEDAERKLQARVVLPSYFPDTLAWPPAEVRYSRDDGGAVALVVNGKDGAPAVFLAQTVADGARIPDALAARLAVLQQQSAPLGDDAVLARVVSGDGALWNQLEWNRDGRHFVLRGRTSLDDLIRMARSIHRERR